MIWLLSLALLAQSAAGQQFDLVCAGTLTTETFYAGRQTQPYSTTYRLDLERRKYCEGDCRALRDIADIQPTTITLQPARDIDTVTRKEFYLGSINRETGAHRVLSTSGRRFDIIILNWEGRCERRPFSGFPEFQTQF